MAQAPPGADLAIELVKVKLSVIGNRTQSKGISPDVFTGSGSGSEIASGGTGGDGIGRVDVGKDAGVGIRSNPDITHVGTQGGIVGQDDAGVPSIGFSDGEADIRTTKGSAGPGSVVGFLANTIGISRGIP